MLTLIGSERLSSCGSDIAVDRTAEYAMGEERDLDALNDRLEQFRTAGEGLQGLGTRCRAIGRPVKRRGRRLTIG